jgi:hypothetical protein
LEGVHGDDLLKSVQTNENEGIVKLGRERLIRCHLKMGIGLPKG